MTIKQAIEQTTNEILKLNISIKEIEVGKGFLTMIIEPDEITYPKKLYINKQDHKYINKESLTYLYILQRNLYYIKNNKTDLLRDITLCLSEPTKADFYAYKWIIENITNINKEIKEENKNSKYSIMYNIHQHK